MVRALLKQGCFIILLSVQASGAAAQLACADSNIYGSWQECVALQTCSYYEPPAIRMDSLKSLFYAQTNFRGSTWHFNTDGTYVHERVLSASEIKSYKSRFWVVADGCALKLATRKRNPIRIVYLDDSCMITWFHNPHTAYVTVYRRYQPGEKIP